MGCVCLISGTFFHVVCVCSSHPGPGSPLAFLLTQAAEGGFQPRTHTSPSLWHLNPQCQPCACPTPGWCSALPAPPSTPTRLLHLGWWCDCLGAAPGPLVRMLPTRRDSRAGLGGTLQAQGVGWGSAAAETMQSGHLAAQAAGCTVQPRSRTARMVPGLPGVLDGWRDCLLPHPPGRPRSQWSQC